jgi:hypothetical protein
MLGMTAPKPPHNTPSPPLPEYPRTRRARPNIAKFIVIAATVLMALGLLAFLLHNLMTNGSLDGTLWK